MKCEYYMRLKEEDELRMIGNEKQTTIEDRVYDLEREVNKMRDLIWMLEADVEDLTLAQHKNEVRTCEGNKDINKEHLLDAMSIANRCTKRGGDDE